MPPLTKTMMTTTTSVDKMHDDDDDESSTCSVAGNKLDRLEEEGLSSCGPSRRRQLRRGPLRVRFSAPLVHVYEYEGVARHERDLVWYTEDEELEFLIRETRRTRPTPVLPSSSSSGHAPFAGFATTSCSGECGDNTKTVVRALQLGSLVLQGVCLRAIILGHAVVSEI